jgi:hypothetical protein
MFILTLVLMPILAFLYLAYSDVRTRMANRLPNAQHTTLPGDFPNLTKRHIRWITQQELPVILRRFENVILVDVRSERGLKPSLYSGSHVLPTSPEHLNDLLPWLPPETSVLLCGPPDLCKSVLFETRNCPGSAPIYVLGVSSPAVSLSACALIFLAFTVAASTAFAQSPPSTASDLESSSTGRQSSSTDQGVNLLYSSQDNGQNNGGYDKSGYKKYPEYAQSVFHHLAIEGGAGFDAPIGNTSDRQTSGYNIKLGGGWNFNQRFGALIEYEFNRSGIPNAVLTASGAPEGNVHIWGFTLDPIYYLKNNGGWGGYVTGGYGFYRRLTSFTEPVSEGYGCDFYGYCYPQYGSQTLSHFSSNEGGGSIGGGLTHSLGNGGAKAYVEARYLHVAAPSSSSSTQSGSGYGATNMIPVTFGIRF